MIDRVGTQLTDNKQTSLVMVYFPLASINLERTPVSVQTQNSLGIPDPLHRYSPETCILETLGILFE